MSLTSELSDTEKGQCFSLIAGHNMKFAEKIRNCADIISGYISVISLGSLIPLVPLLGCVINMRHCSQGNKSEYDLHPVLDQASGHKVMNPLIFSA